MYLGTPQTPVPIHRDTFPWLLCKAPFAGGWVGYVASLLLLKLRSLALSDPHADVASAYLMPMSFSQSPMARSIAITISSTSSRVVHMGGAM